MDAECDSAEGEHRGRYEGTDTPAPLAEQDRDGDCEGRGGMVAGKAGVGGVRGKEVDPAWIGDERPRSVNEFRDHLADREG